MSQMLKRICDEPGRAPDLIPRNGFFPARMQALADVTHDARDIAASISSVLSRHWGW